MPSHGDDPHRGKREESSEHRPRGADRALQTVRQKPGEQPHQPLAPRPVRVIGRESRADRDGDAVRDEDDEA